MIIYLPQKSDLHRGLADSVKITFKGRYILMSTEIEVNNCFVVNFLLSLLWLKSCSP